MSSVIAILVAGQFFLADRSAASLRESRKAVQSYSKCIIKRRPDDAVAAVLSASDNATILKDYPKLIDPGCLSGFTDSMAFPGDLFRYALADALVNREIAAPALQLAVIPPLQHSDPGVPPPTTDDLGSPVPKSEYNRQLYAFGVRVAFADVSRFGECVVRADAPNARSLLASRPTSLAETKAISALRPTFSPCLAKGNKLHLTKEVLRGTIALNYYRLSKAPRVAEAVK